MEPFVRYRFDIPGSSVEIFDIFLDDDLNLQDACEVRQVSEWQRLDFCKCPNCLLSEKDNPVCPMMKAIGGAVSRFDKIASFEVVDLSVLTETRTFLYRTTAQRSLSSLLGLLIAVSGCPHTVYFRPMAIFHLPLATEEETAFRAAGMYLVAQYLRKADGLPGELGLSGLKKIYEDMKIVNRAVAARLRSAADSDSLVNAVILLDLYAKALPVMIDMKLDELRPFFSSYLSR